MRILTIALVSILISVIFGSAAWTGDIITSSGINTGALTAIPRWKVYIDPADADHLWLVHGNSSTTGSVWESEDGGDTWDALGTQRATDYHASIDGDGTQIFIGVPVGWDGTPDDPGTLRRWTGSAWADDIAFDDYSGAYSNVNILKGNGDDVFAFVRSTYGGSGTIYWHRSTNGGESFGSATAVMNTGDLNYKRMGGLMISGQPAVTIGYIAGAVYRYRLFRWDGEDSFDALTNDSIDASTNDDMNRIWTVNQTSDGEIHIVYRDYADSNYCLRYSHRTLTGSWASPSTICTLTGEFDGECIMAVRANTLYLAYIDTQSGQKDVFYRTLDSGGSWSDQTKISSGGGVANCNTCRDIGSATYFPVVWDQAAGGGNRTIKFEAIDIGKPPSTPTITSGGIHGGGFNP